MRGPDGESNLARLLAARLHINRHPWTLPWKDGHILSATYMNVGTRWLFNANPTDSAPPETEILTGRRTLHCERGEYACLEKTASKILRPSRVCSVLQRDNSPQHRSAAYNTMSSGTVRLNNYLQSKGLPTAVSWVEVSKPPEHAPTWLCECKISGKSYGIGQGSTKQAARNVAAEKAMARIDAEGGL
ncbi:uncharacterized protein FOMMEDRAFT_158706 [Fomitiporia mediterranea MF3/22]|uniref:uncharacterized protein n=1 Tax=Fomitiporia mediterranea (strain MF3/22) TaxID=694068 RepID=UPI0004408E2A|nr:uncharacterized protein FOMMEDRAFT_158706 [Fomitiporia mediterranea MF3/22]EJD01554.1 hypothetical protein FOMMEDRAFT_158706 [Fomitiporia mediterranea MF3/22]